LKQQPLASLRQQQIARWVALLMLAALAVNLLLPTLANRLAVGSQDRMFLETCSATGFFQRSEASTDEQAPGDSAPMTSGHCLLCTAAQAWLPPDDARLEVRQLVAPELVRLTGAVAPAVQRLAWARLPARAPPLPA
jgi:hypothetical protein